MIYKLPSIQPLKEVIRVYVARAEAVTIADVRLYPLDNKLNFISISALMAVTYYHSNVSTPLWKSWTQLESIIYTLITYLESTNTPFNFC